MLEKLEEIERRFESVEADYNNPEMISSNREMQRLGRLRAELEPIVLTTRDYRKALDDLHEAEDLLSDPEMKELAAEEIEPLKTKISQLEENLKMMLIPKDPNDERP